MTAYELADRGFNSERLKHPDLWNLCIEMSKMLCQQADRIAELEKQGEPVAWMEYIQDEEWEVWYTKPTDLPEGHSYKPLYLAPQRKPLSDDEIWNWFKENTALTKESALRIARAIEETHGIK